MKITIIAALAQDGCIGRAGDLPWSLPGDLKRFKAITIGHPVVMGRKTWDTLPRKPLAGRLNIVVSRSPQTYIPEVVAAASLPAAFDAASATGSEECFVIGGAEIYRLALPLAQRMLLTRVGCTVPDGDTWFPDWREDEWVTMASEEATGELQATYQDLARKTS